MLVKATTNWRVLRLLAILALAALPRPALAQVCNFSIDGGALAFGTIDTGSGAYFDTTTTLTANCVLGLPGQTVKVCPHFGAGSGGSAGGARLMKNGTNSLSYQMFSDASRSTVWGGNQWTGSPPLMTVQLGLLGVGTASTTIYGRVAAGQVGAPPGFYASSMAGQVAIRYRTTGNSNNCNGNNGTQPMSQPSFNITAYVQTSCQVTAAPLDFGTTGLLDAAVSSSSSLSITCPNTTSYSVALSPGSAGAGPTARTMKKGSEAITYGLYRDSNMSQPWGDTVGTTLGNTGTGSAQSIPVYGRVPVQDTPSSGTYTDTVVVTVTY